VEQEPDEWVEAAALATTAAIAAAAATCAVDPSEIPLAAVVLSGSTLSSSLTYVELLIHDRLFTFT
jgi:hypothetical protein